MNGRPSSPVGPVTATLSLPAGTPGTGPAAAGVERSRKNPTTRAGTSDLDRKRAPSRRVRAPNASSGKPEEALARAAERFRGYRDKAVRDLERLGDEAPPELFASAQRQYAADLGRLASARELRHLAALGLVSTAAVDHAAGQIADYLKACERSRLAVAIDADEDVGA
jgi:hypothetical protein